ncbi:hypothetical protein MTO96_002331 [Rhipicephalus appendiculatus]
MRKKMHAEGDIRSDHAITQLSTSFMMRKSPGADGAPQRRLRPRFVGLFLAVTCSRVKGPTAVNSLELCVTQCQLALGPLVTKKKATMFILRRHGAANRANTNPLKRQKHTVSRSQPGVQPMRNLTTAALCPAKKPIPAQREATERELGGHHVGVSLTSVAASVVAAGGFLCPVCVKTPDALCCL